MSLFPRFKLMATKGPPFSTIFYSLLHQPSFGPQVCCRGSRASAGNGGVSWVEKSRNVSGGEGRAKTWDTTRRRTGSSGENQTSPSREVNCDADCKCHCRVAWGGFTLVGDSCCLSPSRAGFHRTVRLCQSDLPACGNSIKNHLEE